MPTPKFEPTWESLAQFTTPEWYKKARFGIFIHWGIYAVPAYDNEWYSRNMYLQGHHAYEHHQKTWGHQSEFGYKDFIPLFKAEKFNADEWVSLFKEAGARYIVPVAEHHDGFPMYDSAYSNWTAAKMGPKRDVIQELADATRKQGLSFGLSSHRAEHWFFMNGGRDFDSDVQDPAYEDFYGPAASSPVMEDAEAWGSRDWEPRPNAKFLEDWLLRCQELVDKYQPQLIYFDWWIRQIVFEPYLQRFAAYYYNQGQGEVAINCKNEAFPPGTMVADVERGQLTQIQPDLWQTDTSVSKNAWAYIEDHDYKDWSTILHDLIDIVSKNGTLLLNIGPRPDGTIPEPEVHILKQIGRWLAVNGEAIHESMPWKVFGEGPTEVIEGELNDTARDAFTAEDIRFTTQGETLYAIVLGQPEGKTVIKSLSTDSDLYPETIQSVELLGHDGPLQWERTPNGLEVTPPAITDPAWVLKITHA